MSDDGTRQGVKGVAEKAKGMAKELGGEVVGDRDMEQEGQAQQQKAEAQQDVAKAEARAEKERAEAQMHEAQQRTHQD